VSEFGQQRKECREICVYAVNPWIWGLLINIYKRRARLKKAITINLQAFQKLNFLVVLSHIFFKALFLFEKLSVNYKL